MRSFWVTIVLLIGLAWGRQAEAHENPLPGPASLPSPQERAEESCEDGTRNGPESDVDCGGDCLPCEPRSSCNTAADCLSGLCASGVCRERKLERGEPIPKGYEVRLARHDAAASVRRVGCIFLGVSYGAAYIAALSYPSHLGALYIPAGGPWVAMDQVEGRSSKILLATDGALQAAGAALLIGGIVRSGRQLVKRPPEPAEEAWVHLMPRAGRNAVGLAIAGRF